MQRRAFIKYVGSGALTLAMPMLSNADSRKKRRRNRSESGSSAVVPGNTGANGRVVVLGGGMGGATAAKYLRLWGRSGVEVILIDRSAQYYSCILSNLVLNGTRTLKELTFDYTTMVQRYGINFIQSEVSNLDLAGQQVVLSDGSKVPYDRLVLSPGVEFDTIPGLETTAAQSSIPHAWKAGAQTNLLRDQIKAMPAGGVFVLTIPPAPFRCPPGPYERACVVADYLKRTKPRAKVIVLDANSGIVAERENFTNAFNVIHAGIVEYHPSVPVLEIDATNRILDTGIGKLRADVINAIPPHRAGKIISDAGLNNVNGKWAGVDVLTYESTIAPGVHVVGDSSATTQPKAGHVANAEAKVCADAITRIMRGDQPDPSPVTNSSCYSPISATTASWLSVVFYYDPLSRTMKPIGGGATEASGPSGDNFEQMEKWFANLMSDTFA